MKQILLSAALGFHLLGEQLLCLQNGQHTFSTHNNIASDLSQLLSIASKQLLHIHSDHGSHSFIQIFSSKFEHM
jgi:hypothetical protein